MVRSVSTVPGAKTGLVEVYHARALKHTITIGWAFYYRITGGSIYRKSSMVIGVSLNSLDLLMSERAPFGLSVRRTHEKGLLCTHRCMGVSVRLSRDSSRAPSISFNVMYGFLRLYNPLG